VTAQGYPDDYDIMWAACDRNDHIGVFLTAGQGPVPKSFLDYEDYEQGDLESRLLELPERGDSIAVSALGLNDEELLAKIGLYVFDWSDVHRTSGLLRSYEMSTRPSMPLVLSDLDPDLHRFLSSVRFPEVEFSNLATLDVELHLKCLHSRFSLDFEGTSMQSSDQWFRISQQATPQRMPFSIVTLFRRLLGRQG